MSNIIELDIYKSEVVSQRFKRTLIEVFKDPIFHCSKFVDGKTIQFFLRASR